MSSRTRPTGERRKRNRCAREAEEAISDEEVATKVRPRLKRVKRLLTSTRMVKVYVGEQKKQWQLHQGLLCDRSDYFKRAFEGKFREGHAKEIHLKNTDPAAFGCFVEWAYGAPLKLETPAQNPVSSPATRGAPATPPSSSPPPSSATTPSSATSDPSEAELQQGLLLCKLYTTAQCLCIKYLQDDVMDVYTSYIGSSPRCPETAHIEYVYTHGHHPSPLHDFVARKVAEQICSSRRTKGLWDSVMKKCPTFAIDVVLQMQDLAERDLFLE